MKKLVKCETSRFHKLFLKMRNRSSGGLFLQSGWDGRSVWIDNGHYFFYTELENAKKGEYAMKGLILAGTDAANLR